ncbi:MAG: hypothetical protein A2X13_07430 [Bacteroidetes bacterium GWC2_33_15]|nr:MAG: hypothetical protein A2X10_01285 [Bacteroidetes bacterium GWA2_33_15]OFX48618.1 MAG: hypothetical protein A2X13_07430 [Bacteroidetes bacterium GWC2_33_15]OFX64592.1 MAG: hypothetical protein A2X15_05020 [Bacteroidetes bacterium GWB2_32_14]OFX67990.1 MAG: hypothetical protein A2X14_01755 [Bacteroidetes bacterium GWD2_33_33]HAN18224.1 hypothetical protein [Bacteroidales bacterium]
MKKSVCFILLIFSFFLISNQLYSSNPEIRLKKLHYENSLGEKGVTTFFYSQDNKNYNAKWELLDGSRYSINYHFLDKKGNLIRKYKEFSDSMTSNNFYKYDNEGNLIEDYFERSDKVKGTAWYKYENGRKVEAECRGFNGYFYGFIQYKYENNRLVKGIIFKEGKETGFIDYTYDNTGNLITEYWNFGNWNQTFTYEYEISDNIKPKSYSYSSPLLKESSQSLIKEEKYNWNGEKEGISYYSYDDSTKLVKKVYEFKELNTITTYEYDNEGLLMVSHRSYSDGRKDIFYYHYIERKLVRRLCFGNNGFFGSETYNYDKNGILLNADWIKFDSWLTGTINFEYDENNNLKSGLFKGKDNFDAQIEFEIDDNKNLIQMHWEFTFGKYQTYIFTYFNQVF